MLFLCHKLKKKKKKNHTQAHVIVIIFCYSLCWGWSPRRRWGWAGLPGRGEQAIGWAPLFLLPVCGCSQTGWCCPRPEDSAPAGKMVREKTIREPTTRGCKTRRCSRTRHSGMNKIWRNKQFRIYRNFNGAFNIIIHYNFTTFNCVFV